MDAPSREASKGWYGTPDFITEDYADDAVVICNMISKPAVGKAEIERHD